MEINLIHVPLKHVFSKILRDFFVNLPFSIFSRALIFANWPSLKFWRTYFVYITGTALHIKIWIEFSPKKMSQHLKCCFETHQSWCVDLSNLLLQTSRRQFKCSWLMCSSTNENAELTNKKDVFLISGENYLCLGNTYTAPFELLGKGFFDWIVKRDVKFCDLCLQ